MYVMCYVRVYEGDEDDPNWLYSSDPHISTNATCGHGSVPGRHMAPYPTHLHTCHHHHQHHHNPVSPSSPCGSAAGWLPAVETSDPVESGTGFVDHEKFLPVEAGEHLSTDENPDVAMSCVTCDLDYYVVEYVMKSQRQRVKDLEQEFGVTIKLVNRVCEEIVTVAFQRYNPGIQVEKEEKAHRAFLALYEVVFKQIVQRTVQTKVTLPNTPSHLLTVINRACKDDVFASTDSEGLFTLVGPFEKVTTLENFILNRYGNQSTGHSHVHDHGKFCQDDDREEFRKETDGGGGSSEGGPMSVFEISGRLTVKIYTSDITRLPLDVIVNAANEHLQNYAGVAGAIERAGGEQLKQDCETVVQQGGPLKV